MECTGWHLLTSVPVQHLRRSLDVCQTKSLPLGPELQDKQIVLYHRRPGGGGGGWGEGVGLKSVLCPGVCSRPELASTCYTPMGYRNADPAGHQSWAVKGHPLGGSRNNQGTRHKNWYQTCIQTAPWERLPLWKGLWKGLQTALRCVLEACPSDIAAEISSSASFTEKLGSLDCCLLLCSGNGRQLKTVSLLVTVLCDPC